MEWLQVRHIKEVYQSREGEVTALQDVSFSVDKGEVLSIVGPSGCGKSTLLSIIAGLLPPSEGEIILGGEKLCGYSPRIGYMLQRDNLLEWHSVLENVLLGLRVRHALTKDSRARAEALLERYGLSEFKDRYPSQLSGGMRQRVALIRTLAISPDLLLLDEAFSALDYQTRMQVTEDVYRILKQEGVTTLMVTHDIPESIGMGDRVLILSKRPATVREMVPIRFAAAERTPLSCREDPLFNTYFLHIWKELSQDAQDGQN